MSNEFTRSHVGEGGKSLKDSAYQLVKCSISARAGQEEGPIDIRRLVGFIRIHENLFNPSLFFEIGIRDDYNFFDEFKLKGDEIIKLEFETKVYDLDTVTHKYEVHVTKINDYARGDSQVHAYTLIGVSKHAWYAPLMKTNMVCNGITTKSIIDLCKTLDVYPVQKPENPGVFGGGTWYPKETCISKTHTVFGMKNPLQAALDLLSVSLDELDSPYFLYQTLSDNIYLAPLSWINDRKENPVYKTFTYTDQLKSSDPNTELEYFERSSQIVKLSSNIGTSPLEQLVEGRGPTTLYEMNLNTKAKTRTDNDPLSNLKWLIHGLPGPVRDLAMMVKPYIKYRFTQPNANGNPDTFPPLSVLKARHEDNLNAQIVAYDSFSHQFTVMGDMLLNPGRTIHLQFPKTLDPVTNPKSYTNERFDTKLTKDYLIFQAVHTFQEGKHTTDVTAKSNIIE